MPFGIDLSASKLIGAINKQFGKKDDEKKRSTRDDLEDAKKVIGLLQKVATSIGGGPGIYIGIFFFIVIFFFFFQDTDVGKALNGGGENGGAQITGTPGGPTVPQVPGLTVKLSAPSQVANGTIIEYTVTVTYDESALPAPIDAIELFDSPPTNAEFVSTSGTVVDAFANPRVWKLSETINRTEFYIRLRPTVEDVEITYTISGRVSALSSGGSGSNSCTAPYEGTGYCSVNSLLGTFNGNQQQALIASMICQAESRSNPFAVNTVCKPGIAEDYSVGLFQINLTVHCPGAYGDSDCTQLIDIEKRNVCEQTLKDPLSNIQKMFALSAGTYWTPWSTWPGVESQLKACGIL